MMTSAPTGNRASVGMTIAALVVLSVVGFLGYKHFARTDATQPVAIPVTAEATTPSHPTATAAPIQTATVAETQPHATSTKRVSPAASQPPSLAPRARPQATTLNICEPPYYFDADNNKIFKKEVFVRLAAPIFVMTLASAALASPTKEECVDANARGQVARKQGRLHAARTAFQTCADNACPSVVRHDCNDRLADVTHAMPTITLEATDGGRKITNATVTVDGAPFATSTDGSAIEIDPGGHHFVFHMPGRPDVVRELAVDEAARAQLVSATFEDRTPAAEANKTYRNIGIGLGVAGLGGILVGVAFGIATFSAWGTVKSECFVAATCDVTRAAMDRNDALTFATVSDIAFIAGGVLAAAGTAFLILGVRVVPTASPRVIGLSITETF